MKKFLSIVLAAIMLVSILPTGTAASGHDHDGDHHDHDHETSTLVAARSGDSCLHPNIQWVDFNTEQHTGYCSDCQSDVYADHEYGDFKYQSLTDHGRLCSLCVVERYFPHIDENDDGKCDDCKYAMCTHEGMVDWTYATGSTHMRYCDDCRASDTIEYVSHADEDNDSLCDDCGWELCLHPNLNSDGYYVSDTQHKVWCNDCKVYVYEEHTGGTANCFYGKRCDVCDDFYGEPTGIHLNYSDWLNLDDTQCYRYCLDCRSWESIQTIEHISDEISCYPTCTRCTSRFPNPNVDHVWDEWRVYEDGPHRHYSICSVCKLDTNYAYHEGGEATCAELAQCELCYESYGDLSTQHGEAGEWFKLSEEEHARYNCNICQNTGMEKEAHYGGEATCTEQAVCEVCSHPYGELDPHSHANYSDWGRYDDSRCFRYCLDCQSETSYLFANHMSNDVSCYPTCECCQQPFPNPGVEHAWSEWIPSGEHHEYHERYCTVCRETDSALHEGGEASCTNQAVCNVCHAFYGNVADGHDYQPVIIAPTCTEKGYTVYICSDCSDSYVDDVVSALGHWFSPWNENEGSTHYARCIRDECGFVGNVSCTAYEVTIKNGDTEEIISICPVCGEYTMGFFPLIENALIAAAEKDALPYGEQNVRGKAAPFEGVLYAFTAIYEVSGRVAPFEGKVSITLPLDGEVFTAFTLVRVDAADEATGERAEAWTEIPFTFENGSLTFETDAAGLFLLLPVQ